MASDEEFVGLDHKFVVEVVPVLSIAVLSTIDSVAG
jgi:hypothetical protein